MADVSVTVTGKEVPTAILLSVALMVKAIFVSATGVVVPPSLDLLQAFKKVMIATTISTFFIWFGLLFLMVTWNSLVFLLRRAMYLN